MTHLQEHWEGVSLPGDYTLEQWLSGDGTAALFQTSLAGGGRAVVKLIPEASGGADRRLGLWQRTRHLRHPNVVELLDCGRAEHNGETAAYAVLEFPEDTLASGLSRGPLDGTESRQVLESILGALRYLHAQGLVHGAVDGEHILAVGEHVKLSTDALNEAAASSAYREDARMLGELWRDSLMPACPKSAEIVAHAADPNPESRWTLAEIASALARAPLPPPQPVAPPAPVVATPTLLAPVAAPPAPPTPIAPPVVTPPVAMPEPREPVVAVRRERPTLPPLPRPVREPEPSRGIPKWIPVGAAALLLLILGIHWWGSSGSAAPPKAVSASRNADPPAATPAPEPKPSAPKPASAVPETKPAASEGKEMWRVIAFTYRTRVAAAKKAQQLNDLHPGIHADVFSPKGKGYYLVSLGGRMTHDEALRVQRTSRGKGLPRDLYVQNYSQ